MNSWPQFEELKLKSSTITENIRCSAFTSDNLKLKFKVKASNPARVEVGDP